MNPIARMMKRYIKMPLKYALPLLFIGALVLVSTTGCISVTPGHATPNAPTGAGTNYDVSISAREVTSMTSAYGSLFKNATPGNKLVAIECSLKDNNVANLFTVWREWTAKDVDGTVYQFNANVDLINNGYPKTTIQLGDTARGIIPYEIPINAKIASMRYTDETTGTHTLTCNVTAGSSSMTLTTLPIVTGTPTLTPSATQSATSTPQPSERIATSIVGTPTFNANYNHNITRGSSVHWGFEVSPTGGGILSVPVTVLIDGRAIGQVTQVSASTATVVFSLTSAETNTLSAGSHTLTASFAGDSTYQPSELTTTINVT